MNNYPKPQAFLQELEKFTNTFIEEVKIYESQQEKYSDAIELTDYYNKKSAIGNVVGWNQIRFICQSLPFLEFMEKNNLTSTSENPTPNEFQQFKVKYEKLYNEVFPKTSAIIQNFFESYKDKVTMISIYRLEADKILPVHANFDPHMHRCHMGLIIPEGDVGILVEGEKRSWKVGEFFAFDSTRAHTVWNKTDYPRWVFRVDCYRPDIHPDDAIAVHKALVDLRMKESKLSLGLSGGRSELDAEAKKKYASPYENIDT